MRPRTKKRIEEYIRKRSCVSKRFYDSRFEAENEKERLMALHDATAQYKRNIGLNVYRCPYCDKWHVGHK